MALGGFAFDEDRIRDREKSRTGRNGSGDMHMALHTKIDGIDGFDRRVREPSARVASLA